ncbi:MAG: hypothetical protein ACTSVZ_05410 [Promethearchaeota archaeon]
MVLLQTEPNVYAELLNSGLTLSFTFIGLVIMVRSWIYIQQELKTSPVYTKAQKFRNTVSAMTFSLMISISIIFVMAMISSIFARNALLLLPEIEETIWNEEMIRAFQFPNYLPITLLIITVFAFFYPIYEYYLLSKPSQEGTTEIQQGIENKIIDKFETPWNSVAALFVFLIVVLVSPIITSYIALNYWNVPSEISDNWVVGIIFFVWLLLGPMFYLSYYSYIGTAHTIFRGNRVVLKNEPQILIFYIIAILGIISTVYSLVGFSIDYIPVFWGEIPACVSDPSLTRSGMVEEILTFIYEYSPNITQDQLDQLEIFFVLFPLDFIGFIITTSLFGLFGFYKKFLSKEPLNTSKMVLFAAYIITGIAFSIFMNAVFKYPDFFPDDNLSWIGLDLNLENVAHRDLIYRTFGFAILIQKLLNIYFLVHFLFIDRNIRQNSDEWVLNRAIIANDFETIRKYSSHENLAMRKLVADSVINYVKMKDKLSKQTAKYISKIIGEMLSDENSTIVNKVKSQIEKIILKLDKKTLFTTLTELLSSEEKSRLKQARNVLRQITKKIIIDPVELYNEILQKRLSTEGYLVLFQMVGLYEKQDHKAVWRFLHPLLSSDSSPAVIKGSLDVLDRNPRSFTKENKEIIEIFNQLLTHNDVGIVVATLRAYGNFAMEFPEIISPMMGVLNSIKDRDDEIVRQKIGAIVKCVGIKPEWFSNFFEYLELYLRGNNLQHKSDAAVALGSIAQQISVEDFKTRLYPYFQVFVNDRSLDVRKATLSSLIVIAQTRDNLYALDYFQHLFSPLLIDENLELRHQVHRFFVESESPQYLLGDIAVLLKTPLSIQIRVDLLHVLSQIAEKIVPYLDENDLMTILKTQAENSDEILEYVQLQELQSDHTTLFGFKQEFKSMTIYGSTLALFSQFLYYSPEKYEELFLYLESHYSKGGEIALAKLLDVYLRILIEKAQNTRKGYSDITIDQAISKIQENITKISPNIQSIVITHLTTLYPLNKSLFEVSFEVIYNFLLLNSDQRSTTKKQILVLLASIIGDHPKYGFKSLKILNYKTNNHEKVNPFEDTFKKLIYRHMREGDSIVQEGVSKALLKLIVATNKDNMIRNLILETIKTSKDARTKITALNVLMDLPVELYSSKTLSILEKQVLSTDPFIKAKAIEVLGYIIRSYPKVSRRENSRAYKKLKKLLYNNFFKNYSPEANLTVKKAIMGEMRIIALSQPEISSPLRLIIRAVQDPNPAVGEQALQTYFDYAQQHGIRRNRFQHEIRNFANSNVPEVLNILVKKLLEYYQQGTRMQIVIPTLIKLAASNNPEIRANTHSIFMQIFKSNPDDFMDYFNIIFKLISDRNPMVRRDGGKMLLKVLVANPELFAGNNRIFYNFQRLAFDSDPEVRFMLAENLAELYEKFPDRTNDVLNMCYNLIRFNDDDTLHAISLVLKDIWAVELNFRADIISKLSRFYKKSQDAVLLTLITDLEPKRSQLLQKRKEKFLSKEERKKWKQAQKEEEDQKRQALKDLKTKKYKELYGEKPPFNLEGFEIFGRFHRISEFLLYAMFATFFAIGIWSLYTIGADIKTMYSGVDVEQLEGMSKILGTYSVTSLLVIVAIYIVSLLSAYFVVRVFAEIALVMMYLVLFVQVALLYILYEYVELEYNGENYNWIFLALIIPSILFLTIWNRKFKKASVFLKMSCMVVVKEKQMLIPQVFQTMWVNLLSFFYGLTAWKFFFNIEKDGPTVVYETVSEWGVSDEWMFVAFTALFVFLIYIVFYTTLGMKQLMIHHWYRGGSLSFGKSYRIIRRRWWGVMGYAFTSTIIHMIQFVTKFFKGEYRPKTPKEAMEMAAKIKPVDPQSFDKTKKVKGKKVKAPLVERLWMSLNMFTMPAIVLEKRPYSLALARSIRMIVTNTVDLYLKKSNINVIFRVMQYIMWATSALIGGFVGAMFGWVYDVNMILTVSIAVPLFLWVGGFTQTLILNDLNTAYVTIMYMHTLDIINKKHGYTRYKLEKPKEIERWEKRQEQKEATKTKKEDRKERRKARKKAKIAEEQEERATTRAMFPN